MKDEFFDRKLRELNDKLDARAEKAKAEMRENFSREIDRVTRILTIVTCMIGGAVVGHYAYNAINFFFGGK